MEYTPIVFLTPHRYTPRYRHNSFSGACRICDTGYSLNSENGCFEPPCGKDASDDCTMDIHVDWEYAGGA